ncbi:MAG: hypothetical protein IPI85_14755 [Dehalococcoidia bacterium]|nr:hypothetical protein [Dehalococcoidia bacterium]
MAAQREGLDADRQPRPLPVLQATHRDLARLGLLWLRKGKWRQEQLLDESFVDAALEPPFPEANTAYGYLWWLNKGGGTWRDPKSPPTARDGKRIPGAPENVYTAQGARGKLIMVIPDHDMVVVTLGETNDEYQRHSTSGTRLPLRSPSDRPGRTRKTAATCGTVAAVWGMPWKRWRGAAPGKRLN